MAESLKVIGLDHIVLNVSDVERSLHFYVDELGLEPLRVDAWRRKEVFFPSVRVDATTIIDLLPRPPSGDNVDHFCLVVEPTQFDELKASGGFDVADGPSRRFGAQGDGMSLYIRDPDKNLVELRYYDHASGTRGAR
jgi:catechol 2,3-dioxygenase-like lactoylglutathione lyase family enzyme